MSLFGILKSKFSNLSENNNDKFLVNYLNYYGYLPEVNSSLDTIQNAVREFQEYFDLVPDGVPGPRTLNAMLAPRCSCKDVQSVQELAATQRKWRKVAAGKPLVVSVHEYVGSLGQQDQLKALDRALNSWAKHTQVNFQLRTNRVKGDINVYVGKGRRDGFDGQSGTLAYAGLPQGNDVPLNLVMDDAETWIVLSNRRGTFIENVFCHELGHTLGLDHTKVKDALMAPYYSALINAPLYDDIKRIQGLYGVRREVPAQPVPTAPTPTPTPSPTPSPRTTITLEIEGSITNIDIPGWHTIRLG